MIDSKVQTPIDISTVSASPPEPRPPVYEPQPSGTKIRIAPPPAWVGKMLKWLFPVAALLFVALIAIPGFLQKWLWMRQLDYAGIFWTLFSVKVGLTCTAFAFAFLFLWLNVQQASKSGMGQADWRTAPADGSVDDPAAQIRQKAIVLLRHIAARSTALIVAVVAAIFATGLYTQWDTWLRFHYGGAKDSQTLCSEWI